LFVEVNAERRMSEVYPFNVGNAGNGQIWSDMVRNGQKWLEMVGCSNYRIYEIVLTTACVSLSPSPEASAAGKSFSGSTSGCPNNSYG
jgi:hypothetical protein